MTIKYDLAATLLPYPLDRLPLSHDAPNQHVAAEHKRINPSWLYQLLERNLRRDVGVYSDDDLLDSPHPIIQRLLSMITPARSTMDAHLMVKRWAGEHGIVRCTPEIEDFTVYDDVATDVGLLNGFRLPVDELLTHDPQSTIVLSSPNGISGRVHLPSEVARLARHFRRVVLDEQCAAFSLRRLTPIINEWANVIAIERLPFIMPGQTLPFAWITHPAEMAQTIAEMTLPPTADAIAELNTYWQHDRGLAERSTTRLRAQLYREMRKLSIVSVPYPSWANFLLARVERGDRDEIAARLADREIAVYVPPHGNLKQHFRITAASEEATFALKDALIEINRQL